MEIPQIDALVEYESSLHNELTIYNYRLILLDFFGDLGIANDSVQLLRNELLILKQKKGLKRKDGTYQENQKKIQEKKEGMLRVQANEFVSKSKKDPQWAYEIIKNWFIGQQALVDSGKKDSETVKGYLRPIRGLLDKNEVPITSAKWDNIESKIAPSKKKKGTDRAYTREEIRELIKYGDKRIPPICLSMTSCGCRVGAFWYLNLGHITPIYQNEDGSFEEAGTLADPLDKSRKLVASRIIIYWDDPEEYLPFITPEATRVWEGYVTYRKQAGERVTKDSFAIRDLFPPDKGARGQPNRPIRYADSSTKNLVQDALVGQGLRPSKLPAGVRRHEVMQNHGMRKFFETTCDDHDVNLVHSEKLMGHTSSLGLKFNYNRSEWKTLLNSYLKVIPYITITNEEILLAQRDIIAEKNEDTAKKFTKEFKPQLDALKKQLNEEKQERKKDQELLFQAMSQFLPPEKRSILKNYSIGLLPKRLKEEADAYHNKFYEDDRERINHLAEDKKRRDKEEEEKRKLEEDRKKVEKENLGKQKKMRNLEDIYGKVQLATREEEQKEIDDAREQIAQKTKKMG